MRNVINYYKRKDGNHIVEHIGFHESGDYMLGQLFESTDKGYRKHQYDFEQEFVKITKEEVDALERTTCESRFTSSFEKGDNLDHWRKLPNGDRTCSFCGSLHPEDVTRILTGGLGSVERSTKGYKWYINQKTVRNASEGGIKYYRWHDTPEFVESYNKWVLSLQSPIIPTKTYTFNTTQAGDGEN